jgi:hypothetical protein
MKNNILKKLLLLIPLGILAAMLALIDYTVEFMKETTYTYVYNTNVGSVQRFSKEIEELSSEKYNLQDNTELFTNMIHVYNKTLGEKEAVITFLLNENAEIVVDSAYNEAYLADFFDNEINTYNIKCVASSESSGELILYNQKSSNRADRFYYQYLTSGQDRYYVFMGINRQPIEAQLNVHQITIPISVIGLLLLIVSEGLVWQKMFCIPYDRKKETDKEG